MCVDDVHVRGHHQPGVGVAKRIRSSSNVVTDRLGSLLLVTLEARV